MLGAMGRFVLRFRLDFHRAHRPWGGGWLRSKRTMGKAGGWCTDRGPPGTKGQEQKVAEGRGEGQAGEGEEEGTGRRHRVGASGLAGTEASPTAFPKAAALCQRPHLPSGQLVGRTNGRPWAPLLTQSGPACGPAGVGTVTVAKCANLCHCPQARGSHGDWLI